MATSDDTLLSRQEYNALKKDVEALLRSGSSRASARRIEAYWKIGQRITEQRLAEEAGYHNSVLRDLARDTGTSVRTLQRAVTLHDYYEEPPAIEGLTWAHVRALLQVPQRKERRRLAQLAVREGLTARELAAFIDDRAQEAAADGALARPDDPSFLYRAEVHSVVDGDTLELDIDLGFHVFRRQRIRLASLNCPDVRTTKGRAAKHFVTEQVLAAPMLVVKTNRADIYGRYVAHVFLGRRGSTIESCFTKGIYLNSLLIEHKLARRAR